MNEKNNHRDIEKLLRGLFNEDVRLNSFQLKEIFEERLDDLSITKNQSCLILGIEHKTLDSILKGDSKKIDFVSLLKLSNFLEISTEDLIAKYFELAVESNNEEIEMAKKRSFIINNFDLSQLKKIGFINSINDFESIENRIKSFFGYDNIFEYGQHKITAVLSSGKRKSAKKSLDFWFETANKSIDKTPNPHIYQRDGLIKFFPEIRGYCTNVENGLMYVAQKLFTLGVTVIIVPKFNKDLHLRGATFESRGKPCIALTKYTQFYPTIWFTLIHELFHVLYDWDKILKEGHHFSIEDDGGNNEIAKVLSDSNIDEHEANEFAQQYLFSSEKLKDVLPHIDEPFFVEKYAKENHVHPSFIYTFYLWKYGNNSLYAKYNRYFPKASFEKLLAQFRVENYLKFEPVSEISRKRNINLNYNAI